MLKGIKQGVGVFLGLFLCMGLFAITVGTVKTWTTGETLTAADLNQTVQSLKTAVESASQLQKTGTSATSQTRYTGIVDNNSGISETDAQIAMPRAGTVKNILVAVPTNTCTVSATLTLRNNGVDTSVTYTIGAGVVNTTPVAIAQTVVYSVGDKLTWKTTCSNGSIGFTTTYDF